MKIRRQGGWAAALTLAALVAGANPSLAATATPTPSPTATDSQTATASPSPTDTSTASPTASPTDTSTGSPTASPTDTAAPSPTPTQTTAPTPIQAEYAALGGAAGIMGASTSDEDCMAMPNDGCQEAFQNGAIYWSAATGAHPVMSPVVAAYLKAGGPASLGYPKQDPANGADGGTKQAFEDGTAFASAAGAFFTTSPILAKYTALGAEASYLGYPTSPMVCGLRNGGCYQDYRAGAILWSPATGAISSHGGIRASWAGTGFENGYLGYPTTEEVPIRGGGVYQNYQGGAILWSPATGAHTSHGATRTLWGSTGFENGFLGYPTSDEVPIRGGGVYQNFQGGAILWSPATGAHISHGAIRGAWAAAGFENGSLGYPITDELCDGSGCIQKYQGGTVTWLNGPTGVHPYDECESLNNGHSNYPSYGARAVSFAVAESYGSYNATFVRCQNTAGVYWPDWVTGATVGKSGFKPPGVASGPTRYEYSPTGDYSVTLAFGLGNPGTALPYQTLNPNSRWGGNPWTPQYNQYFEESPWVGYDENMWFFAMRGDYKQGAVLNYNRPPDSPIIQDAGFAIFLREHTVPTAGCIALPDGNIVNWLQKAHSGDRIIMGVRGDLFR